MNKSKRYLWLMIGDKYLLYISTNDFLFCIYLFVRRLTSSREHFTYTTATRIMLGGNRTDREKVHDYPRIAARYFHVGVERKSQ